MYTLIRLYLICQLFNSCTPIVNGLLGVNKQKAFQNSEEYVAYVQKMYAINSSHLYYLSPNTATSFINSIISGHTSNFYGVFTDKHMRLDNSDWQKDANSCYGRVVHEINNPTESRISDSIFIKNEVIHVASGKRFFPENDLKTIVVVFSVKQGRLHQKDFEGLQELFSDTTKYALCFVSMDPDLSRNAAP